MKFRSGDTVSLKTSCHTSQKPYRQRIQSSTRKYYNWIGEFVTSRCTLSSRNPLSGIQVRQIPSFFPCTHSSRFGIENHVCIAYARSFRYSLMAVSNPGLLFIHRNFFTRAMLDFPDEPLRSPFAPSVIASYRNSVNVLRLVRAQFDACKEAMGRMWPVWARAIMCAVSCLLIILYRTGAVNFMLCIGYFGDCCR